MKKSFLVLVFILLSFFILNAQQLRFTPVAGYTFADKFRIDRGDARIGDGFTYGGMLSYVTKNKIIELQYIRQEADFYAFSEYHNIDIDGTVYTNYIFIGGKEAFNINEAMLLFAGTNIGMGIYSGKETDLNTEYKLAIGIDGGLQYLFTEKVGLRLQANLYFPITYFNTTLWWGGGGSSVGVSSVIPFLQFGFLGGIVFNLN